MVLYQIEEQIGISTLKVLKKRFELADSDGNGKLSMNEFRTLLRNQLKIPNSKVIGTYVGLTSVVSEYYARYIPIIL